MHPLLLLCVPLAAAFLYAYVAGRMFRRYERGWLHDRALFLAWIWPIAITVEGVYRPLRFVWRRGTRPTIERIPTARAKEKR